MVNNLLEIVMPEALAGRLKTGVHFCIPLIHREGEMADRVIKIQYILRRGKNTMCSNFRHRDTGRKFSLCCAILHLFLD